MSDTLAQTAPTALLAAPEKALPPAPEMIVQVARDYRVSPFRQFREMVGLRFRRNRMDFNEYYTNRLFDPEMSAQDKCGFVGKKGNTRFNKKLSPIGLTKLRPFVRDKVLYGAMMQQLGFRTPETQAVVSTDRGYGVLPRLADVEGIEAFLMETARYPLFVKPGEGWGSVGSALIVELDRTARELVLSNGQRIDLRQFAQEVLDEYGDGFIFQTAVEQHADMTKVAGPAIGSIRVVTVYDGQKPSVLYTLWKVPSPKAMSDNYWQSGSMLAEIDKANGQVVQCRRGEGPTQEAIETHPASGMAFADVQIPFWDEICDIAVRGHEVLPQFGVLGWDIAVTPEGPLIIECNANPHHMLYQLATGRGIQNPEFMPVFERVIARAKDRTAVKREQLRKKLKK
ncbi:sugar-transfer associated ATP-grasp domain-containing protein [Roseovarius sp. MMSF_3281]|uniref:sugar-transfer associated ATP-grasp domain-containing protein n=1 Tax=Roseovarius sp. MMSF_3281 TaxID=3046694 RepID=UPI00273DFA1C|nr:sugar-transfer associated ATP-grasp domain-containing protein [Roseovarius sp. MMSF_3281]